MGGMDRFDLCIVGAGVVGLALAMRFSQAGYRTLLLERHERVGSGISSRNSEVIHAGLYYQPDSLKARLCVEGRQRLYEWCAGQGVPFRKIGKLIVATTAPELQSLDAILGNALASGVTDLQRLGREALIGIEPEVRAVGALWSPETGIVDSHALMQSYLACAEQAGCVVGLRCHFDAAEPAGQGFRITVTTGPDTYRCQSRWLINSAGLRAQTVARQILGLDPHTIPALHWCKGHYFSWRGRSPLSHLIYPVPGGAAGGLGIHATLDLGGQLRFGPDAHYIDTQEAAEPDYEVPDVLRDGFVRAIRRWWPAVDAERLAPATSGIRPRLHAAGADAEDFRIADTAVHGIPGLINLFGIESPGLTGSLALADAVFFRLHE